MYFGGARNERQVSCLQKNEIRVELAYYDFQVSKIENCGIKRQGDLPFDFRDGSCNTFFERRKMQEIFLCFDSSKDSTENTRKTCHA